MLKNLKNKRTEEIVLVTPTPVWNPAIVFFITSEFETGK